MRARPAYAPLRLLAAALALALATSCGARAGRPNAAPKEAESAPAQRTGPKITLTDAILEKGGSDTVRFGRLHSGEIAELRVWLVNDASRAVAVASYGRSCGCTTLEFDREPVAPGAARRLRLRFDSRGEHGWQLKTVDLHLAGAARPLRIFVEAEIE